MMRGGGLYGRPRGPSPGPSPAPPTITLVQGQTDDHKGLHTIPQMASPTTPQHLRPYGNLGWRLRLMPIGPPRGPLLHFSSITFTLVVIVVFACSQHSTV